VVPGLGRECDPPGIGLGIGDEFGRSLYREILADQQQVGNLRHDRHRFQRGRVEIELLVERDVAGDRRGLGREQRVAVGLGGIDRLGADIAAPAASVLDHEGLAELLLKLCGNDAGYGIDSAPRRCAHDDPHGVIGIVRGGIRLCQRG